MCLVFQDCCLIVYHPYRPLLQYVQDMGQEDMLLPLAWYRFCLRKPCCSCIDTHTEAVDVAALLTAVLTVLCCVLQADSE